MPPIGSPACHLTRLQQYLILGTGSSSTRLFLSLVASSAQPGTSLTLGATSRYLYKLCLSKFDGRHNVAHAGTYLKCTRVFDLENASLYCLSLLISCRSSLNGSLFFSSSFTNKSINLSFDLLASAIPLSLRHPSRRHLTSRHPSRRHLSRRH